MKPDNTSVRTALWRALHLKSDDKPYIFEDEIGIRLVDPQNDWQERPDMKYTKRLRASIIARARFIEDFTIEQIENGITQYVILGAGLDTFAQRRKEITCNIQIFEIDQKDTLIWKQKRLTELGFDIPKNLNFVSVNFETSSWFKKLLHAGFDKNKPSVFACTGVSLYLTKEAIISTLQQISALAEGSKLVMSFYLPKELLDEEDKQMQEIAEKGAREAGTPMLSFFTPEEILEMSKNASFKKSKLVTRENIIEKYFKNRSDELLPASGEVFLLAET